MQNTSLMHLNMSPSSFGTLGPENEKKHNILKNLKLAPKNSYVFICSRSAVELMALSSGSTALSSGSTEVASGLSVPRQ